MLISKINISNSKALAKRSLHRHASRTSLGEINAGKFTVLQTLRRLDAKP